jgi:hypothetical protein
MGSPYKGNNGGFAGPDVLSDLRSTLGRTRAPQSAGRPKRDHRVLWFRAAVPDGGLQPETLPAAANLATPRFFYGSRVKCNFHPPLVKILTIKYNTTPGLNLQAPLPKTVRWFAAAHPVAHAGLFTGNGTA